MEYDLIRLTDDHKGLILNVSPPDATRIYLDPLDKGLSGASVWLAQWDLPRGIRSALAVLKINVGTKIFREFRAYEDIVQHLDSEVGAFRQFRAEEGHHLSILVQPFKGDPTTYEIKSLRNAIAEIENPSDAVALIDRIYLERMRHWHPVGAPQATTNTTTREALDWWTSRYDFLSCIDALGRGAIGAEIERRFNINADKLDEYVRDIMSDEIPIKIGPVHGDLHSQNILIEEGTNRVHLIDFGWTANKWKIVDFIMLECSLKFLAFPYEVRCSSLVEMENVLEEFNVARVEERLDEPMMPKNVKAICAAIARIRQICCVEFRYVDGFDQYRKGLIVLTAALATYKGLNRRFLVNSLAFHISKHLSERS